MERIEFPMTRASFNLTRACNLACDYCFTNGCTKGSMPFDTAKKGVDLLINCARELQGKERAVDISFWGGEPLIEWELLQQIVLYAEAAGKENAVPVMFGGTTNGTLLTPEKFDFLDEHRILFMISLDGMAGTHDLHRKFRDGRGSHSTIVKNCEAILKKWPNYRARMALLAERVEYFYEDICYLFDLGFDYLVFSPVYEGDWTDDKWQTFEDQGKRLVDYMVEQKAVGRNLTIEHFKSYSGRDQSKWPCGAGRFYVGFDIDGAIYPCHRFNKFNDSRPWQEKEVCIGHLDVGITRPEFRDTFINYRHQCGTCSRLDDTPCHGGCYAVNFDFGGHIDVPVKHVCNYVTRQKKISDYCKEKKGMDELTNMRSCICNNMCYAEGTPDEIRTVDSTTDATCICNHTNYAGSMDPSIARPLRQEERGVLAASPQFIPIEDRKILAKIFKDIDTRLAAIEKQLGMNRQ